MAITTYSGIQNGVQQVVTVTKSNPFNTTTIPWTIADLWNVGNNAGTYNTTAAGAVLSSTSAQVTGQLLHVNPPAGTNCYVAGLRGVVTNSTAGGKGPLVYVYDRLWHSGGYSATTTTAQTVNSPTWPARDIAGSTNGDGVLIAFQVQSALGANPSANVTISYTNQAGTAGRTGTIILPSVVSGSVTNIYFFGLQSGDTGVRSVQSVTLSSSLTSGSWGLVAMRVLALMPVSNNKRAIKEDGFTLGLPRLYDGSVPVLIGTGNAANSKCQYTYYETLG